MKYIYQVCLILAVFLLSQTLHAQNRAANAPSVTISGILIDTETKQPLEGVSISDRSKKTLTISKRDGSYSVNVPKGTTLYFTAISHITQTLVAERSETGRTVSLSNEAKQLENVTVTTALGISRQQKTLGYSVQSLLIG